MVSQENNIIKSRILLFEGSDTVILRVFAERRQRFVAQIQDYLRHDIVWIISKHLMTNK